MQPELQRKAHLFEFVHERRDVAGCLAPVAGWSGRAHVNDVHGRDLGPFTCERTPPDVAQAPADDLLRFDVDDQERLFEAGRPRQHRPFIVDDAGVPVEDQLVLASDGVAERDEAEIVARASDEHLFALAVSADIERRGGDVHEELCAGEREIRCRGAGLP